VAARPISHEAARPPGEYETAEVTDCYVDACLEDEALRTAVRRAVYPPVFRTSYEHALLDRPFFVSESRVRQFADDLATVFRLLVSLPRRLFDDDLGRYCAAAGIDAALARLMTRGATGSPPLIGRSDAYDDGVNFKLLEFNSGTELGGIDFAELNRALLDVEVFRAFADEHSLDYVDTADIIAETLRRLAEPVAEGDLPVVVLLETTGGIAAHPNFLSVQEAMRARGIDFRLGEVQELRTQRDKLTLGGAPVDVAMRFYAAGEILECPYGEEILEPIVRAHEEGKTILYTTLENSLFGSKGGLALLSDEGHRGVFSAGELAVIDRVVPWTRVLVDGPCATDGTVADMVDYCRANRESLILKPCVGWGAAGALLGREASDEAWAAALTERAGHGYVAQRVVTPVQEPVCNVDTGEVEGWIANWGVFVFDGGYAGSFVRALRPADGSIVAFSNKETRGTGVFSYRAEGAR
jgi:hypothetical protein